MIQCNDDSQSVKSPPYVIARLTTKQVAPYEFFFKPFSPLDVHMLVRISFSTTARKILPLRGKTDPQKWGGFCSQILADRKFEYSANENMQHFQEHIVRALDNNFYEFEINHFDFC